LGRTLRQVRDFQSIDLTHDREADTTFDWFKDFGPLKDIFTRFIPDSTASIVMLGCGNALLSEQMYDAGYRNIFNVDYSEIVIQNMQKRCADRPEMTCTHLFDVID
jgi:DNA polymerase III delta prime subunit